MNQDNKVDIKVRGKRVEVDMKLEGGSTIVARFSVSVEPKQ